MEKNPDFDLASAHKYFSAECFNRTWDFIEKTDRTTDDDQAMLLLSMASLWHWTQRQDCTSGNLSVGYWQISRVYSLLHQPEPARQYAQLCLKSSQGEGTLPFHLGYAYEALARAEQISSNPVKLNEYLDLARKACESIKDTDTRKQLLADLETIGK
jgi:hypothetical protein